MSTDWIRNDAPTPRPTLGEMQARPPHHDSYTFRRRFDDAGRLCARTPDANTGISRAAASLSGTSCLVRRLVTRRAIVKGDAAYWRGIVPTAVAGRCVLAE